MKAATFRRFRLTNQEEISIHAAREGGDAKLDELQTEIDISIHAAREGGDCCQHLTDFTPAKFQSTPPVKAATGLSMGGFLPNRFQSTPPVKAATLFRFYMTPSEFISIHAAREGGDFLFLFSLRLSINFNPRRP